MTSASLLAFVALGACLARAQPGRRSPRGTITQTVNGTEISIRYYRPVLRGRVPFPGVVSWGRTWTPGADSATRLETSGAFWPTRDMNDRPHAGRKPRRWV